MFRNDHVYFIYFMHALNFIPVGIYLKQFSLFELYFKIGLIFKTNRCKGFFNRMVQNKRVYTCVAECNCQYCQHHPDSEALYWSLCSSARSVIVRTNDLAAAVAASGHHQQPNDPPAGLSNGTPHHHHRHHCPSSALPPTPQQQQHNSHKVQQHKLDGGPMADEDYDTPMISMTSEDKATSLHYGITWEEYF